MAVQMPGPALLVSIVIPAYKPRFFERALRSALEQTWPALEVVVCDDSNGPQIEAMVQAASGAARCPVRYLRNSPRLGELGSTRRGTELATGHYIKFLHDDDVLEPECVATLVAAIESAPGIALASSRRRRIGELGRRLPDVLATQYPFAGNVRIDGPGLVSFLADHTVNFIGEPSCVLCRRADLLALGDLTRLGGRPVPWVGDLALYARLLQTGDLALLSTPLSGFRVSRQQFSQRGRLQAGIGEEGHAAFRQAVRDLGWYRDGAAAGEVRVGPLDASSAPVPVDLRHLLQQAREVAEGRWRLHAWQVGRTLSAPLAGHLATRMAGLARPPRLGVLVLPGARAGDLERTVVRVPLPAGLDRWIECAVLGAEPAAEVRFLPLRHAAWDPHAVPGSLNQAMAGWDVDWIMVVRAGTEFVTGGLTRLLVELAEADPGLRALYADQWYRDDTGHLAPVMRPDLNLDLLLGNPAMLADHWVFRRDAVLDAGGFDPAAGGAAELDLVLRLIQVGGLGGIGHLPEPLVVCAPPAIDAAAQQRAILRHLHARGYTDAAVHGAGPGLHRIEYGHPSEPSVSLVLLAPDDLGPLERCVVSVLEQTAWPVYELLLVDNGCPPAVRAWMDQVEPLAAGRVRVLATGSPVAPSLARNLVASQAHGEFLLFLDAGAAALQPQWLHALLNHALRPEVGIVGARTVDAAGQVTHAGLVPGLREGGGRIFAGRPMDADGYMSRLKLTAGCSAVSGDCLLVPQDLFAALGGFDADTFPAQGADIDLCLRAGMSGRLVIWTPEALMLHAARPAALEGAAYAALCARWLPQLARDPAYNPNLRLDVAGGFELDQAELEWDPLPWHPLPRVLALPSDSHGSGHYRVTGPLAALCRAGMIDGAGSLRPLDVVEVERFAPDILVMQRRVADVDLARFQRLHRFCRAFKVFELDDWLPELPRANIHRRHMPRDVARRLREGLAHADRLVVSTAPLAEACKGWHADIRVARNRLDPEQWLCLPPAPARAGKPRVGWAGGVSHDGDLALVADVVRALAGEVDWVFFGMCPERLRPHVAEFHPGVPLEHYPQALAALGLDLAIAPLEDHPFNRCKSNLRLLEYGACGYPVVCTDIEPYREPGLPVTRVRNRHHDWVDAIRMHLAEPEATAAAGRALREAVHRDWMLEGDNLLEWQRAWLPD